MDATLRLLSFSAAMLVGSYLSGSIPLAFTLSEKRIRLVSILGAGLIVGTALAVIIPEGVHSLYESRHVGHEHAHHHAELPKVSRSSNALDVKPADVVADVGAAGSSGHYLEQLSETLKPNMELHSLIGLSLCLGFILMLLVDQISGGHSHGDASQKKSVTATIGLIVHAAADGIALGAASSTSRADVEMIVFMAIMLHKAPAAFGLASFLLHEKCDRNRIRRHMLAFSLSAPIGALLTYYGLSQTNKEALSSVNGTGLAMLFSAGTFLYVATVHILPEISNRVHSSSLEVGDSPSHHGLSRQDLFLLIVGIMSPLFLGMFHKH